MMMYLAANAYPEIQFAVHQCARFTHCPRHVHAQAVKKICRYLKYALDCNAGLTLSKEEGYQLDCYVDADFAGLWRQEDDQDPVCVKSRTGYVFTLAKCPVLWKSSLQTEIALSMLESEYIALSQALRELIPARRLLEEIVKNIDPKGFVNLPKVKSIIWEDNNGCISTVKAPKLTPRTKHIAVKYHFSRSHLNDSVPGRANPRFFLDKNATEKQLADTFTKGLAEDAFVRL